MLKIDKRLLVVFGAAGALLFIGTEDVWIHDVILAIGVIIGLLVLVTGFVVAGLTKQDPNEVLAKSLVEDSWSPHDTDLHSADEEFNLHVSNYNGGLDSLGCLVEYSSYNHILWFSNKYTALCFFRDHYHFLTEDYHLNNVPYEDKFDEKVLAKFDKLIEGDEPSVTIISNFLTKLFPGSFDYIGTLSQISKGKKAIGYLRSEYRAANNLGTSNGPISHSHVDGFIEFLHNYEFNGYNNEFYLQQ